MVDACGIFLAWFNPTTPVHSLVLPVLPTHGFT